MKSSTTAVFVSGALASTPYLGIALLYVVSENGTFVDFLKATFVLYAIRFFFMVADWLGGVVVWRVYGRNLFVYWFFERFVSSEFPKRRYANDSFIHHANRLTAGELDSTTENRVMAGQLSHFLTNIGTFSFFAGLRLNSAAETAFDMYSPKSKVKPDEDNDSDF